MSKLKPTIRKAFRNRKRITLRWMDKPRKGWIPLYGSVYDNVLCVREKK